MRTDNEADVGLHVWERFGLGKAPFRYVGCEHKTFRAHPTAPAQPGSSCDYCGQGISQVCWIADATGHRFKVGCDCVERVGEDGIMKAYKASPNRRKIQRDLRHTREANKIEALTAQIEAGRATLEATPHSKDWAAAKGLTAWDEYEWWASHAGNAGKLKAFPRFAKLAA